MPSTPAPTLEEPTPPVRPRPAGAVSRVFRTALALVLAAAGVLVWLRELDVRFVESRVLARLFDLTFADRTIATTNYANPAVLFQHDGDWKGLVVTMVCGAALLLTPALLVGAVMMLVRRVSVLRALLGTVVLMAALEAMNLLRLLGIGFGYATWGRTGFEWMHGPVSTIVLLGGLVVAMVGYFRVLLGGGRRRGARRGRAPAADEP